MESPPHHPKGTPEDPILAAGVVLWRQNSSNEPEFLLLRNSLHLSWGLAKGHQEDGEPIIDAALRELAEETGYRLQAKDLLEDFADTSLYQPKKGLWKRVITFLAAHSVEAELLQCSAEHDQHMWLPADQAMPRLEHNALRRTIRRAATRLAEQTDIKPKRTQS